MQALRVARPTRLALRRLTTAAPTASSSSAPLLIPLNNVEAQWEKLSKSDQTTVQRQLEEIQKKDWKALSLDEKKAGMSSLLECLKWRTQFRIRIRSVLHSLFGFLRATMTYDA